MTKSLIIRDIIQDLISPICDSYHLEAPESAVYPYAVHEERKVTQNSTEIYTVEINVWDKYKTYSRVEKLADEIEKALDREYISKSGVFIVLHANYKQNVDDPDKQIKRMQVVMDANVLGGF